MPDVTPVTYWAYRNESSVWDALTTLPSAPRLSFVRGTSEFLRADLIPVLLGADFDGAFTVFASDEEDFRRDEKALVPGLAALRDSPRGQLIRCVAPKGEEERIAVVSSWWGCGRNLAGDLLALCGGDLTAAFHAVGKAKLAGLPPLRESLPVLVMGDQGGEFADLLVRGDRKGAMAAAEAARHETAGILALLSVRVSLLALLGQPARPGETSREAALRLKVDPYVLGLLRPHAAAYSSERLTRCREILALAESAWRSGARDGVLEAVAALW